MVIYYRCKCGNIFDGHWKRFPQLEFYQARKQAMICPMCGNEDEKKNIESDEDFKALESYELGE